MSPGDWVLELVTGPVSALEAQVKGPVMLLELCGPGQQTAVLQTGGTGFKEQLKFTRHVRNLARYYAKHHLAGPPLAG